MDFRDLNALPEGLGFSLALDLNAMTNFVNLSDSLKEELINYIQDSDTGEQARDRTKMIVSRLHEGKSVEDIPSMNRFY